MKNAFVFAMALVAWSVWGNGKRSSGAAEAATETEVAPPAEEIAAPAPVVHQGKRQYDAGYEALVASVDAAYDVPAWNLDATRRIESGGVVNPTADGKHWFLAKDLAEEGSACEKNGTEKRNRTEAEAREWCQRQWKALRLICLQTAKDGTKVCDPDTVVVSKAFAMGEMQILPTNVVAGGKWRKIATDFDGDGAVNPFSLPDALAMSAKLMRAFHDRVSDGSNDVESWMRVADKYRGESVPERHAKLRAYGAEWCATHFCDAYKELLAAR